MELLFFPNRVCSKHGAYNQEDYFVNSELFGNCPKCEDEQSDYESYVSGVYDFTTLVSDVEDALKGRFEFQNMAAIKGDVRVQQAFDLLNGVLGELVVKKNEMKSQLV